MATSKLFGDVDVSGRLRASTLESTTGVPRSSLEQEALASYPLDLTAFRMHDAVGTVLPVTAANDDLGLVGGAVGTGSLSLQTGDLGAAGATTRYGRVMWSIPPEYDAAETCLVRLHAGMITAVSDGTATVDVQCYVSDKEAGVGADLCTTAAQSCNSLTFADLDFTITATSLSAGDVFDIRVAITVTDTATPVTIGCIGSAEILLDIRG